MARAERKLSVTLVKSAIGYRRSQKETVRLLGLRKRGQTVELPDTAVVRGMLTKIEHLVEVHEAA